MQQKFGTVLCIMLVLVATSACGSPSHPASPEGDRDLSSNGPPFDDAQPYQQEGFAFYYPDAWKVMTEEKNEDAVTVRFDDGGDGAAQMVISYFAAPGYTAQEALDQGQELLKSSLASVKEEFDIGVATSGEREWPVIRALSGTTEVRVVEMVVVTGAKGFVLATLVVREEAEENVSPIFYTLVDTIQVD